MTARGLGGLGGLLAIAVGIGCYRDPAPPVAQPRPGAPPASTPARASTVNALFPIAEVRAVHKCTPNGPALVSVLIQGDGKSVSWFQIDLDHGERDVAPRAFTIGKDARVTGCRVSCNERPTGSVMLDELAPGTRARGRYRFVLDNGDVLQDGFDATWQGKPWDTELCPRS